MKDQQPYTKPSANFRELSPRKPLATSPDPNQKGSTEKLNSGGTYSWSDFK